MNLIPAFDAGAAPGDGMAGLAAAALVLGASGSLHCFLMCGPLACSAMPLGLARKRANSALAAYHAARIAAYAAVGGALGASGSAFSAAFALPLRSVVPWLLVAALLASVFNVGRHMAPLPGFAKILRAAARLTGSLPPQVRAAIIGGMTPLLPCGLLYGVFAAAFHTASAGSGVLLLASFAVGGAPALLLAQFPGIIRGRLHGVPALLLQKGVPLVAAAVIALRALHAAQGHACH